MTQGTFHAVGLDAVCELFAQILACERHAGFGIVGDKLYGQEEACYLEFIQTGWTPALEAKLLLPRHALHSARMELETDNSAKNWLAPLADDMEEFIGGLNIGSGHSRLA